MALQSLLGLVLRLKVPPFFYSQPKHLCDFFSDINILRREVVVFTPNSQPGGPRYLFLSRSSTLTSLAWEAMPIVTLPPAYLSGTFEHASPITKSLYPLSDSLFLMVLHVSVSSFYNPTGSCSAISDYYSV
jgi:hypothetical protein